MDRVGAVLLGAELFVIRPTSSWSSSAFRRSPWASWSGRRRVGVGAVATFGVLSVVSLVFFRGWLKRASRAPRCRGGRHAGGRDRHRERGAGAPSKRRAARHGVVGAQRRRCALESGARVRVESVDGLTLQVRHEN
jgi:membrane protein implicated in regulation of membrane protease activity